MSDRCRHGVRGDTMCDRCESDEGIEHAEMETAARREVAALRETVLTIVGKWCKRGEILLAMGELTPSELRCVQAATRSIDRQVRAALAEGKQT